MMESEESCPVEEPSKGRSKAPWIIGAVVLGVVAILVLILLILYLTGILDLLPFFGPKEVAPGLMPVGTAIFVSVNPHLEDVAGYQYLAGIYGDIDQVSDGIDEGLADIEEELGISYQEDVRPWLGTEAGLGITGMTDSMETGEDPIVMVVADSDDKEASDAFLQKLRSNLEADGDAVAEREVDGTTYYLREAEGDWDTPLAFGAVKKTVVLTNDEEAMVGIINRAAGEGEGLADQTIYQELVEALPTGTAAYVYMDAQQIARVSYAEAEAELQLAAPGLAPLDGYKAIGLAVNLDLTGIQVDVVSTFDSEALPQATIDKWSAAEANAGRVLARIPADALGFISGQDLASGWRTLYQTLSETPDFDEMADAWGAEAGLSLDEDLMNWQGGEYALVVIPVAQGPEGMPVGLFATLEVDDRSRAESIMGEVAALVQDSVGLPFASREVGGAEMQVFEVPFIGLMLGYGFPDDYLVIGFLEEALQVAVADAAQPITADATYQAVRGHLPSEVSGITYFNTRDIWPLAYSSLGEEGEQALGEDPRPMLEPIKAIGMGNALPDLEAGISRGVLYMYIAGE